MPAFPRAFLLSPARLIIIQVMKSRWPWFALIVPCLALGAGPSAQEILARTAATYKNLKSYQFRVTVQTIKGTDVTESLLTESGAGPGRYRLQWDDPHGELQVGDGKTGWVLRRAADEYTKGPPMTGATGFEEIDQHVSSASIARQELFVVEGKPTPIYVVRVERDQWPKDTFAMYRVDQKTFAVYKAVFYSPKTTEIMLYSIVRWDQPVPDSLFVFKPPSSAHEAPAPPFEAIKGSSIVGTAAPDFTLSDANGRPVNLHDLRGNVVVVDFWATWCPPCRAEMPVLQQMHSELAGKGLVVLGLDVGEDAETVTAFAKQQSYSFPLLLGAEPSVSARYFVEAYPTTFVVDRRGRISFRDLGGESPAKLRAAVEAALKRK
jgi:thiol-disulfide isomerase/thioredoxin